MCARLPVTAITILLGLILPVALANDEDDAPRVARLHQPAPELFDDEDTEFANTEGKVTLKEYRGRIVLLLFFRTDDPVSVEAVKELNRIQQELTDKRVVVIGITNEKKEEAGEFIEGQQVRFTVGFGINLTDRYPLSAPPMIYMIDTEGIIRDRFHPSDRLEEKLQKQMRRTPPIGADIESIRARHRRAVLAHSQKNYGKAYMLAKDVERMTDTDSEHGRDIREFIEKIQEDARAQLEAARNLARQEKFEAAAEILANLSIRFAETELAEDADNEIARLMGRREAKPIMREALKQAQGAKLNDLAAEQEAGSRFMDAIELYRECIEEFESTDAAKNAEKAIERIGNDPAAQEQITERRAEEQADRWLDIGDRYAKVRLYAKAREYYERVQREYPDTLAGSKVTQRLAKLPKEEPKKSDSDAQGG